MVHEIPIHSSWFPLIGTVSSNRHISCHLRDARFPSVILPSQVNVNAPFFKLFTCVGQALVAGLISRAIFISSNPLRETLLSYCVISVSVTIFILKRRMVPSTLIGVVTFTFLTNHTFF